jgi:hypothetical protein
MNLDTGTPNITIESNALYFWRYDVKDSIWSVEIETANGVIETKVF